MTLGITTADPLCVLTICFGYNFTKSLIIPDETTSPFTLAQEFSDSLEEPLSEETMRKVEQRVRQLQTKFGAAFRLIADRHQVSLANSMHDMAFLILSSSSHSSSTKPKQKAFCVSSVEIGGIFHNLVLHTEHDDIRAVVQAFSASLSTPLTCERSRKLLMFLTKSRDEILLGEQRGTDLEKDERHEVEILPSPHGTPVHRSRTLVRSPSIERFFMEVKVKGEKKMIVINQSETRNTTNIAKEFSDSLPIPLAPAKIHKLAAHIAKQIQAKKDEKAANVHQDPAHSNSAASTRSPSSRTLASPSSPFNLTSPVAAVTPLFSHLLPPAFSSPSSPATPSTVSSPPVAIVPTPVSVEVAPVLKCTLYLENFDGNTAPGPFLDVNWNCRKCGLLAADHPMLNPPSPRNSRSRAQLEQDVFKLRKMASPSMREEMELEKEKLRRLKKEFQRDRESERLLAARISDLI